MTFYVKAAYFSIYSGGYSKNSFSFRSIPTLKALTNGIMDECTVTDKVEQLYPIS